jgi:hypothetical protein
MVWMRAMLTKCLSPGWQFGSCQGCSMGRACQGSPSAPATTCHALIDLAWKVPVVDSSELNPIALIVLLSPRSTSVLRQMPTKSDTRIMPRWHLCLPTGRPGWAWPGSEGWTRCPCNDMPRPSR